MSRLYRMLKLRVHEALLCMPSWHSSCSHPLLSFTFLLYPPSITMSFVITVAYTFSKLYAQNDGHTADLTPCAQTSRISLTRSSSQLYEDR